jgi:acyl carrier protein
MPRTYFPQVNRAIRKAASSALPPEITESQSFVFELGFDSLAMARLALALEEELGFAIVLDPWMSSESDPSALTVGSLCEFVRSRMDSDAGDH